MYWIGDVVCWLLDGIIEYLGREDDQVKVCGYWIEFGEIEVVIQQVLDVVKVVVLVCFDEQGNFEVCVYVVQMIGSEFVLVSLWEYVVRQFFDYMVLVYLIEVIEILFMLSGKVDC